MSTENQPMEYPEAKAKCLAVAEAASVLSEQEARAVRSLVSYADEQEETIKMLSNQVADYRTIIRRLTS